MLKNWFSLKGLDCILLARLVMIFLVVRQHITPYLPSFNIGNIDFSWLWFGNVGSGEYAVIFFFCLSGFLHTKILLKEFSLEKIKEFYVKRLSKLLPLFYITNLIYLFSVHRYLLQGDLNNIIKIFTFQYYLEFGFNQVIWFVNIELFFILLLPFLVCILYQNKYNLDLVFSVFIIALIYFSPWFNFTSQTRQYYTNQIIFPILAVSLYSLINKTVAKYSKILQTKKVFYFLFIINIFATIYPWQISKYQISPIIIISYLVMFAVSLKIFKYQKVNLNFKYLFENFSSFINYLGSITYPILLIHMLIVIRFKPYLFENLGNKLSNFGIPSFIWSHIFTFVIFGISLVLAILLFELIEKPISKLLIKLNSGRVKIAPCEGAVTK